jgi:hypothetical protein
MNTVTQIDSTSQEVAVRLPHNNRFVIAKVEKITEKPSNITADEWLHDPPHFLYFVHEYSKPMTSAQAFKTVYRNTLTKFVLTASIGENLYWFLKCESERTPIEIGSAAITA